MLQKTIDDFVVSHRGFDVEENQKSFDLRFSRDLLYEDLLNLVEDGRAWISRALYSHLPNTILEHPILYRVAGNGNILVGVDKRDLE